VLQATSSLLRRDGHGRGRWARTVGAGEPDGRGRRAGTEVTYDSGGGLTAGVDREMRMRRKRIRTVEVT